MKLTHCCPVFSANDVGKAPLEGDKVSSKSSGAKIAKYADMIAPVSTTTCRATMYDV